MRPSGSGGAAAAPPPAAAEARGHRRRRWRAAFPESMHPQIKPEGAPSNVAFPLSLTFLTAARLPNLASQTVIQQLLPNLAGPDSAARRRLPAQVVLLSRVYSTRVWLTVVTVQSGRRSGRSAARR